VFYAPLFSAGAAFFTELSGTVTSGATAMLVLASALSVFTMRGFLADLLATCGARDAAAARVGTVFFVLHPYVLGDKLVRNADAEFLALCLAPIALRGVVIARRRPLAAFAAISGGLAAVVLAHNLTALVVVAFALGTGFAVHGLRDRRAWTVILSGVAAGLALSAFFWLPALALTGLIRPEELLRDKLDFHHQFPPLQKIFWYVRFFATGLATPVVLVTGAVAAVRHPDKRRILVSLLAAAAALLFLQTSASELVWEIVPMLPFFQFPWRMMGPLAWVASALAALLFSAAFAGASAKRRTAIELLAFGLLVLNALPILAQYAPFSARLAAVVPVIVSPEIIRRGAETVTLGDEYLPRASDLAVWHEQRPIEGPVVAASAPVQWRTVVDRGTRIELETTSPSAARLRLARFAWPDWRVEIDGAERAFVANATGTLELEVPAGSARVRVWLEPPRLRRAALWISALSLVAWLVGLGVGYVQRP